MDLATSREIKSGSEVEVGDQKSEDRGQKIKVPAKRGVNSRQRSEIRWHKTDDRSDSNQKLKVNLKS